MILNCTLLYEKHEKELYSPENKNGYIFLTFAQNNLHDRNIGFVDSSGLDYTYKTGLPKLRSNISEQIGNLYKVKLQSKNMFITNGATHAIELLLSTICKTGDTVAVQSPFHPVYSSIMKKLGLKTP